MRIGILKTLTFQKTLFKRVELIIINKIQTLMQADKFGSLGGSIITRKAIDNIREQNKHRKLDLYTEINLVEDEQIKTSSLHDLVLKETKGFPNDQQILLKSFYMEGYNIHQIASVLNIARGTVKSRLFTAREKWGTIKYGRSRQVD